MNKKDRVKIGVHLTKTSKVSKSGSCFEKGTASPGKPINKKIEFIDIKSHKQFIENIFSISEKGKESIGQ